MRPVDEGRRPHRVQVVERHVAHVTGDQRLDERGGRGGGAVDEHAHAALDERDGLVGADGGQGTGGHRRILGGDRTERPPDDGTRR